MWSLVAPARTGGKAGKKGKLSLDPLPKTTPEIEWDLLASGLDLGPGRAR